MGIGKAVPQDSMHTDQGTSSLNPYRYKISVEKSYTGYAPFPPKLGWTLPLTFWHQKLGVIHLSRSNCPWSLIWLLNILEQG